MNIALSLFFQSLHRISGDLFTCYLRSCRRQTQKTEQCGHQGLVTEPNGSRHAEDRPRLAAATAIGTPINPRPRTRFRVMREIENSAQILRLLGKRDKIVPGKSSPRSGSDYCHVGFSIQDWVEWMPANGFTSGASGCVGTQGCLRRHQKPHVSFSRSPVSGRRYTLPKPNRRRNLGQERSAPARLQRSRSAKEHSDTFAGL